MVTYEQTFDLCLRLLQQKIDDINCDLELIKSFTNEKILNKINDDIDLYKLHISNLNKLKSSHSQD